MLVMERLRRTFSAAFQKPPMLLLFIFWAVAAIAMLAPERDWDMAAYVALAIQEPGMKADELHAKT